MLEDISFGLLEELEVEGIAEEKTAGVLLEPDEIDLFFFDILLGQNKFLYK